MNPPLRSWLVKSASVPGTSHRKTGAPSQDAHQWQTTPEGYLVAAVADGAGSARCAELGAQVAAQAAVDALAAQSRNFPPADFHPAWQGLLQETLGEALAALQVAAEQQEVPVNELATTLIVLVAGPGVIAAAQIGDGATVIHQTDGQLLTLTVPRGGEYLNETLFVHSRNALEQAQIVIWNGDLASLAMFTDGLQMLALALPGATPHAPFFTPLWGFSQTAQDPGDAAAQLVRFLQSPRISSRADDDLTLLLASPTPA
jgi:hypothetical protein